MFFRKSRKKSGIMPCFYSLLTLLFLFVFLNAETHNHLGKHIHQHPYLKDHHKLSQEIHKSDNCLSHTSSCNSVTVFYEYYSAGEKEIKLDSCSNSCPICRLKILLGFNKVEILHSCYPDLNLADKITVSFPYMPQGLITFHPPSRAPPSA